MRRYLLGALVVMLCSFAARAQTVDELLAKYVKTIGGMDKISAIKSMRSTGKFDGGGGFQAVVIQENKRPSSVRKDFLIQGFTATSAYDGRTGWKISPFGGKKDAETLGEEELKSVVEDSDLDGPLINYKEKGNKIELPPQPERCQCIFVGKGHHYSPISERCPPRSALFFRQRDRNSSS